MKNKNYSPLGNSIIAIIKRYADIQNSCYLNNDNHQLKGNAAGLATLLNMSESAVSQILSGKRDFTVENLIKFIRVCKPEKQELFQLLDDFMTQQNFSYFRSIKDCPAPYNKTFDSLFKILVLQRTFFVNYWNLPEEIKDKLPILEKTTGEILNWFGSYCTTEKAHANADKYEQTHNV